ncbi:MAG: hypothetical protein P8J87_21160, partial [Verrucomicrobiales bacterium]|nr:hypothetical protein [Verrucomicrobiales bacterium]
MKKTKFHKNWQIALGIAVAFTGAAHAGEILIDFNDPDDPVYADIEITGSGELRFTGGADPLTGDEGNTSLFTNPDDSGPSSGYLKVTDNANSERSEIIFPDLENGLVAGSFVIEADLRVGGGTSDPADGFSFSLVRESDPILAGGNFAGTRDLGAGEDNLPEEGTQTGVSVGFDEWVSGGSDIIGISVRVDGNVVTQQAFPVKNGAVDDDQSLQTALPGFEGATGLFLWDTSFGDPVDNGVEGLGWARLKIELTTEKLLTITFKDRVVYSEPLADYLPFAGTFVFGGRTGGANAHHHIDNISIVTTPIEGCVLSGLSGDALGFTAQITDSIDCVINQNGPVTVTFDGNPVPVDVTKAGLVTSFRFDSVLPELLTAGTHDVRVQAVDTTGTAFDEQATFTVAPYSLIDPAWAMDDGDVDKGTGGFRMRMNQIDIGRFPGDANSYANAERQLRDGYADPVTGEPYENLVDLTLDPPLPGTTAWISEVLNHDQDGAGIGTIQGDQFIPGIPGSTGSTDNIVGEFSAVLDLPAGKHTFIFNSDDGFDVSFGEQPLDVRKRSSVGRFDGGRGASDTSFEILVSEAGLYPVRIAWWEGGGGANFEFKMLDEFGTQILINDGFEPGSVKAYANAPGAPAYLRSLSPAAGAVGVSPGAGIVVQLVDGGVAVNDASITLSFNGTPIPATTADGLGGLTIVSADFPSLPDAASVHVMELSWTDVNGGSDSATWSFTISDYKSLNPALAAPVGSGLAPGFVATIYQADPAFDIGLAGGTLNTNETAEDFLLGL